MQSRRDRPPKQPLPAARDGALGTTIERARVLDALDRKLRQCLPPALAPNCRLANVDGDRLVFLVPSPVWKTRLRLNAELLLDAAAAAGLPARQVTVKVATMQPVPPDAAPRLPLSEAARGHLTAAADSLSDPELRALFLKLASKP